MSSSFRRSNRSIQNNNNDTTAAVTAAASASSYVFKSKTVFERIGTKPSKGGLTLTSSGLRELDAIIGGGQPIGTVILIEEDRWTQDLALALCRYWSAEALSQGQNLSLVATASNVDASFMTLSSIPVHSKDDTIMNSDLQQHGMNETSLQSFISILPRNLHLDKFQKRDTKKDNDQQQQLQAQQQAIVPVIVEEEEEEEEELSTKTASITSLIKNNDFTIIEEEEDDEFDDDEECNNNDNKELSDSKGDELLQNAWQYKVSVQKQRLGQLSSLSLSSSSSSSSSSSFKTSRSTIEKKEYCHSYDLSGKLQDQFNIHTQGMGISIVNCICPNCSLLCCNKHLKCGVNLYKMLVTHILYTMRKQENGVIRLLFMNAPVQTTSIALPLLLSYIRSHSLPVVIMVTVRPWTMQLQQPQPNNSHNIQSLISLYRTCDAVFTCEGFDAVVTPPPPEFRDLAGIFSIRKMALQSQSHFADYTTNRRPPANRFGMKRDRRKLHIRMLHLPPEDFSAGGSSVGSGVRSGAGRPSQHQQQQKQHENRKERTALQPGLSCASSLRGKSSSNNTSLDF